MLPKVFGYFHASIGEASKRKTAPNVRPSQVHVHPVKVTFIILPREFTIKELLGKNDRAPVCAASLGNSSDIPPEGMDLTRFEPAPATLTGCCASSTPQAHTSG